METLERNKPQVIQRTKPNWWEPGYLIYMVAGPWDDLDLDSEKLMLGLRWLSKNIVQSKRFNLVSDYFHFYAKISEYNFSGVVIDVTIEGQRKKLGPEFSYKFSIIAGALYTRVCHEKGKLLVGIKDSKPLWVEVPDNWYQSSGSWYFDRNYTVFLLNAMPLFSGDPRQQGFDKLLFPSANRWVSEKSIGHTSLVEIEETVSIHLGFPEGKIDEDEYIRILSDAFLEQKYILIDDRPVLVRLQEHPIVHQIILVKKGQILIARIGTFQFGDFLHYQALDEIWQLDIFNMFKGQQLQKNNKNFEPSNLSWAFATLIASIYRDLVTVEEKEIGTRRVAGKKKPDLKTKKIDPLEPKLFTTSWQYIPRRQYIYNRPNDESFMDREPLSETDQHRQRAIRKWHMVCGHIRRYRDKPDWMASGDKQDQALADGVILRTGETYVRPHARNADALEELGEIDINTIPHYMRRKIAS
jgi:hypothetical protein